MCVGVYLCRRQSVGTLGLFDAFYTRKYQQIILFFLVRLFRFLVAVTDSSAPSRPSAAACSLVGDICWCEPACLGISLSPGGQRGSFTLSLPSFLRSCLEETGESPV